MRALTGIILVVTLLLLTFGHLSAEVKVTRVFLLENTDANEWCAYRNEAAWNAAVQDVGAMLVATLSYSNDHLFQIDVTETDESGDWIVYDHYFLNSRGHLAGLSRMINVLPDDRSVVQTFSIRAGKATKTETTVKQLSTGRRLTSPKPVWLPKVAVRTEMRRFPFFSLLRRADFRTGSKTCVPILDKK